MFIDQLTGAACTHKYPKAYQSSFVHFISIFVDSNVFSDFLSKNKKNAGTGALRLNPGKCSI